MSSPIARHWTIRTRLTLLHGVLVLIAGVGLLTLTYVLQERVVADKLSHSLASAAIDAEGVSGTVGPDGRIVYSEQDQARQVALKARLHEAAGRVRDDFRTDVLPPLLASSAQALGAFAIGAFAIGWFVSGRTLRPIRQITATARRVAEGSLHERIALTGPEDELRELAATFDEMLARLDTAFAGQRRFVANAAHELKTPLAINRTLIEVAMNKPDASDPITRLGSSLLLVNRRHEQLIDGLLALARSEQRVADPVPVDLADLLRGAADGVRDEAAQAGVRLSLEAGPGRTAGDPALLERLVQNLLQNGIRYNVPAGWVRARTEELGDGRVRLTVSNSGPRVDPEDVPGLFEPFRRLADRVGSANGTGLGLSVVRSVAGMHGGRAAATARPEGGLLVEILLEPPPGPDRKE